MTKTTTLTFQTDTLCKGDVLVKAGETFDKTFGPVVGKSLDHDTCVTDADGNELDVAKQIRYGYEVTREMPVSDALAIAQAEYDKAMGRTYRHGFPEDEMTNYYIDQARGRWSREVARLTMEAGEV